MESYVRLREFDFGDAIAVKQQILDCVAALYPDDWTTRIGAVEYEIECFIALKDLALERVPPAYVERLKAEARALLPGRFSEQLTRVEIAAQKYRAEAITKPR